VGEVLKQKMRGILRLQEAAASSALIERHALQLRPPYLLRTARVQIKDRSPDQPPPAGINQ